MKKDQLLEYIKHLMCHAKNNYEKARQDRNAPRIYFADGQYNALCMAQKILKSLEE